MKIKYLLLFITFLGLFSCSKTKVKECSDSYAFNCYTESPNQLMVNLYISKILNGQEPARIRFYEGTSDKGELIDEFYTFNTKESYYLDVGKYYSATAEYIIDNDTILVVNGGQLENVYCTYDDYKCYDWDYEMSINLDYRPIGK